MSENAVSMESMGQATDMSGDDWDSIDTSDVNEVSNEGNSEESVDESKSEDSGVSSNENGPEDNEDAGEVTSFEEEDNSGEEASNKEDSEEVEESEEVESKGDPELSPEARKLVEDGLLAAKEGKLGKLIKIDGKEEFVSLEDLGNDYSGQKAIAKRFSEYDRKEKEFKMEMDAVNNYINDLGNTMRTSSMLDGVSKIAELTGIGPHQVKKALIDELLPEINRLAGLSDDQRELEFNREDLNYQKEMQQREAERFQQQQAQRELQDKMNNLMSQNNVSQDEYVEAENYLYARQDELGQEVTPELVVDYANFAKAESRAVDLVTNFDNGNHKENSEVLNGVIDIILENPQFTNEDVVEIMTDALGTAAKNVVEQKVEKVVAKKAAKQPKPKKSNDKSVMESGFDSDDWDDVL